LTDRLLDLLRRDEVYGFVRVGAGWREWSGGDGLALAELLDYNVAQANEAAPREQNLLCAPLVTRDGLLGVLKVAALHRGTFGPYEARLVSQFLPQASVALQISRRTESLEQRVIAAHRKHAMADLARGVAHDVNNALGAILPLVQQIQVDLGAGPVPPDVLTRDLCDVEESVQVCRRIFGGMLSFARGAVRNVGEAHVRQAVECARTILKDGLTRYGVELTVELEPDLPAVHGVQADLDQLLLNLFTNARDAMPNGGRLTIGARRQDGAVELIVADTGCGIAPEDLAKLQEPFFTTKSDGHGLGLAICRSIVWQMRGTLDLRSAPGQGVRVTAVLPAYQPGM
jgi:signal transduction histidine kinase